MKPISGEEPAVVTPGGTREGTRARDKYSIAEEYERKLDGMKTGALMVAGLQNVSRFFGICALTWATVVLLGGFASSLRAVDFYLASILLLIEAFHLFIKRVFSKLLYIKLFQEKQHPADYHFEDRQSHLASRLDLIGQASSSVVATIGSVLAITRFSIIGRHPLSGRTKDQSSNLTPALIAFYVMVISNSVTAIASAVYRLVVRRSSDDGLLCYHDEVYRRAIDEGMAEADSLEFFDFAYNKLTRDYMRNIQPLTVQNRNRELIKYMYNQKNGVEIACQYLESNDVYKQEVAANLPGFWASEQQIEMQIALFTALSKKLYGAGKVAAAAANSLACIAKSLAARKPPPKPHPFLVTSCMNNTTRILDTLVDLVIRPIRPSLVFQLRALEGCCRSEQVANYIWAKDGDGIQLCEKLENIIAERRPRSRTKIYAASVLYSLHYVRKQCSEEAIGGSDGYAASSSNPATELCVRQGKFFEEAVRRLKGCVASIDPKEEPYVWDGEKEMLNKLRKVLELEEYHWPPTVEIRRPPRKGPSCNTPQPPSTRHV